MDAALSALIERRIAAALSAVDAAEPSGAELEVARAEVDAVHGLICSLHRGGRIDGDEERQLTHRLLARWREQDETDEEDPAENTTKDAGGRPTRALERVLPVGQIVEPALGGPLLRVLFLEVYDACFYAVVRMEDGLGPEAEVPPSAVAKADVMHVPEAELDEVHSYGRLPDLLMFCPTPAVEDDLGTRYRQIGALGPVQGLTLGESRHTYGFAPAPPPHATRLTLGFDGSMVSISLVPEDG